MYSYVLMMLIYCSNYYSVFSLISIEPPSEGDVGSSNRVSPNDLKDSFKDLDSQQIKDSLSSFLPQVPGEFDRVPDTMLRQLLEQRTIGGKDFSPLSGQALLGFRLLPGPVSCVFEKLSLLMQIGYMYSAIP